MTPNEAVVEQEAKTKAQEPVTEITGIERPFSPKDVAVNDNPFLDQRNQILDSLDKMCPQYVHMYERPDITAQELALDGKSFATDEKGKKWMFKRDPVVRIHKEIWEARGRRMSLVAQAEAKAILGEKAFKRHFSYKAEAKDPIYEKGEADGEVETGDE